MSVSTVSATMPSRLLLLEYARVVSAAVDTTKARQGGNMKRTRGAVWPQHIQPAAAAAARLQPPSSRRRHTSGVPTHCTSHLITRQHPQSPPQVGSPPDNKASTTFISNGRGDFWAMAPLMLCAIFTVSDSFLSGQTSSRKATASGADSFSRRQGGVKLGGRWPGTRTAAAAGWRQPPAELTWRGRARRDRGR